MRRPVLEIRAAGVPVLTAQLDIAHARIAFEGGCVANLTASRVSSERSAQAAASSRRRSTVSIDMHARTRRRVPAGARSGGAPQIVPTESRSRPEDPLARELADFVARRATARPLVSGEVGRDALALAERVVDAIGSSTAADAEGSA